MAKIRDQGFVGQATNGPGHLDSRWTGAHQHKREQRFVLLGISLPFSHLKGQQDLASNGGRLDNRFEARSEWGPVVMPKVTVTCARRQDQVVVGDGLIVQEYPLGLCIHPCHLAHEHLGVLLFAEHAANGGRDFCRGEHAGRHLVQ